MVGRPRATRADNPIDDCSPRTTGEKAAVGITLAGAAGNRRPTPTTPDGIVGLQRLGLICWAARTRTDAFFRDAIPAGIGRLSSRLRLDARR